MEYGTIPNVSPAYAPTWHEDGHMKLAALLLIEWVREREIPGAHIELVEQAGRTPFIYIDIPGTKEGTVVLCGHHDKQPGMEGWREGLGPWTPIREGDLIYGRGIADDGYSIFAAIGAVIQAEVHPRVVILIEGSEESASRDFRAYLDLLKDKIGTADVVVGLDADGRDPQYLWLSSSYRGLVNGYLTVETLPRQFHSGIGTGVIPSCMRILRILLDRIEDPKTGLVVNQILNPEPSDEVKKGCDALAALFGDAYLDAYGLPQNLSPVTASIREMIELNQWRAGLEVTGLTGLSPHDRAANAMAPKLTVKLSLRLPPNVDSDAATQELKRVLETNPPYGAKVTYELLDSDDGWCSRPFSRKTNAALSVSTKEAYGTEPIRNGDPAGIPFVGMLAKEFPSADVLITGVLNPRSNIHAPNEEFHIPTAKKLTEWLARFLTAY
jgi:acetylornithine deacetylase/succinyl-diaminopimelate desuccinylase-like protein